MENVVNLEDEDYLHHILSDISSYLKLSGMCLAGSWRLTDSLMGGCSGRVRIFLGWEQLDMASCLPPWNPPPGAETPGCVRDCFEPWELVQPLHLEASLC